MVDNGGQWGEDVRRRRWWRTSTCRCSGGHDEGWRALLQGDASRRLLPRGGEERSSSRCLAVGSVGIGTQSSREFESRCMRVSSRSPRRRRSSSSTAGYLDSRAKPHGDGEIELRCASPAGELPGCCCVRYGM
ncbi:hypothetical protein K431DRAFT_59386 [Polychaeton citri CBS 116435]|uniref:Uncharacterized protein n=1 Tax=Polychaeton citri CBS 116435 TaxID=1314669 RepID=A0A9P4UR00_9PEZI|nr:hypothetical protein K431DRAFT_59386 [Polychaeton citri CBS 116435]